uniref:Tetratricopeptide repeat protein n=1 Tax=Meloidogyne javanica TaxID=6303 RepID=A0A915NDD5_MELJA
MQNNNEFIMLLRQQIKNLKEDDLFDCAVSHLLIFVGANFAGFERQSDVCKNLLEGFESREGLKELSFNELSFGLNKPFDGARFIEHLFAAKEAFIHLPTSSNSSFEHLLWKYRFLNIWSSILIDKQIDLFKQMNELSNLLFKISSSTTKNLQIEFLLERALSLLNFFEFSSSKKCLEEAIKLAGFKQLQLGGALGKRTQFQEKSVPQLFVEFEITSASSNELIEEPTEMIQNTKNGDDTLLEKILFDEKPKNKIQKINSHQIACILVSALLERKGNKIEKQIEDETCMAFLEEVIDQRPFWSLQMRALIERSKLEAKNSRRIERACSQMEILANILNENVKNESIESERLNLIFVSSPLPFWKVSKLHAEILLSLGCFSEAIRIFEKLNYWEDVVKCYLNSGQSEKAEILIKKLLEEKGENPFYYCLLGNITNEECFYLKAIEVSGDGNALARASLGNLMLKRKNFVEAMEHFEKSLDIQPLQPGIYFNYGYSAMKSGNFQTSVKAFHRCVNIEPEHFEAWNNLAASYIHLNQKHRAHKILQEALKLSWENTYLWTNFLLISVDIGDYESGISALEKLMDLDKNLKIDECPLEIMSIEILNEQNKEKLEGMKKSLLRVLARASSRQSFGGKLQRLHAFLKKPENGEDITQWTIFVNLLDKAFKKEFDRITIEKIFKNYKDLLNQFLELINEFKLFWNVQKLEEIKINSQLKLRIKPIIGFFEKEFGENCELCEDEEFNKLFKEIKDLSFDLIKAENVYCTYYRESNEITCGSVTCETHIPIPTFTEENGIDTKLPRGWYRIGTLTIRQDHAWFNLYRRRATGLGYWDFYTQIPERSCVGHFGLHAGENTAGSVTVKDKRCFDRLVMQIERKSTTEKFDVFQCRKCIFNSCWVVGDRLIFPCGCSKALILF